MTSKQLQVSQDKLAPFREAMARQELAFKQAIPSTFAKYLTPERLTKITLAAISRNPLLLECTPTSVLRSVMESASMGLEPTGGVLGHAYLVPYRNNKIGKYEAQLIVGYRGLINLARRSGDIASVEAHVVHAKDHFVVEFGREPKLEHRPVLVGEPGDVVAAYCVAQFRDGSKHCEFMTRQQIDEIRSRSRVRDSGPWATDYDEMARKTVVRRAAKYWPLSLEMVHAFEIEDDAENGVFDVEIEQEEKQPKTKRLAEKIRSRREEDEDKIDDHDKYTGEVHDQQTDDDYGPPAMTDKEVSSANSVIKEMRDPGGD